MQAFDAID